MRNVGQRARLIGTPAIATAMALLAACGGSGDKATEAETASTTASGPEWPRGAAVNAQYWRTQVDGLGSDTKEFADYYAPEFCEKPDSAHSFAKMISIAGIGIAQLSVPYAIWKNSNSGPEERSNTLSPDWADDQNDAAAVAYYIISNYCPEPPE